MDRLDILAMPFVWRAVVAGATIALSAALLGVTLVLRRLSFMGDGLSHVAFGAMAVATAVGLSGGGLALSLPLTALAAVFLLGRRGQVQGDAALAMLSVGAMAAGYLLMNIFPS
ncbi:MAG: metal ABC transporter permease, partial [Kiritimatiellae bacterium]|nr:metal ABC transporter permease [Kiritimatiellia bacterium]